MCTFLYGGRKIWGNERKIKTRKPGIDNLPKKLNVLGKKKEKGRRPVEGLNYAKLLRYSISHMTNLRNQTLDMLLKVCLRFQFQVGHPIADTVVFFLFKQGVGKIKFLAYIKKCFLYFCTAVPSGDFLILLN